MRTKCVIAVLVIVIILLASAAFCAEIPEAKTKTVMVSAFKNGLGFFVRQGEAQLSNGYTLIPDVPSATFGSLWIAANDKGASVDEVIAFQKDMPKLRDVANLTELLSANVGKTAVVGIYGREYSGEIIATPAIQSQPAPNPSSCTDLLMMKINGTITSFRMGDVQSVTIFGEPNMKASDMEKVKRFKVKVTGARNSANLTMGYLQKGISWAPAYMINLEDEKTARITLQAVLVNDVEDLADADVFFVVGFPNFAFSNIISPMALQQSLVDFISSLSQGGQNYRANYDGLARTMAQSASFGGAFAPSVMDRVTPAPEFTYSAIQGLPGAPEEDLFLYSRQHVTLAKGERGSYNVFSDKVAFEHIYEWEIGDTSGVSNNGYIQDRGANRQDQPKESVWHSLRLTNSTQYPWTTAPAMVLSGTKPMSQDTLNYTSKGAKTNLKLTVATDISANKEELESSRESAVLKQYGYTYDGVTVTGTLKLKNYKTKDVKLSITKTLVGDVLEASDSGKTQRVGEGVKAVNPTSKITWEIPLKAGEEKTVTYKYKVFVHP